MENMEGLTMHKSLVDEMRELGRLRTAVMMEKCMNRNQGLMCPKPTKRSFRQCGELTDLKGGSELSDMIFSKASPPFYSGSPPTRASNPLIQDARFRELRVQQTPNFGARIDDVDIVVDRTRRTQSILTMA